GSARDRAPALLGEAGARRSGRHGSLRVEARSGSASQEGEEASVPQILRSVFATTTALATDIAAWPGRFAAVRRDATGEIRREPTMSRSTSAEHVGSAPPSPPAPPPA